MIRASRYRWSPLDLLAAGGWQIALIVIVAALGWLS